MQYRDLGRTGIRVSALSFGAGPIPELLTGDDEAQQDAVVEHAVRAFERCVEYGGESPLAERCENRLAALPRQKRRRR